jgi:hypothetical protein
MLRARMDRHQVSIGLFFLRLLGGGLPYALPVFVLTFTGPGEYSVDGWVAAWANPR